MQFAVAWKELEVIRLGKVSQKERITEGSLSYVGLKHTHQRQQRAEGNTTVELIHTTGGS